MTHLGASIIMIGARSIPKIFLENIGKQIERRLGLALISLLEINIG